MSEFYRTLKTAGGTAGLELDGKALALINGYTMREYTAEELFAFKVTMCDNEVDRDLEAFTAKALHTLASLFQGKTVIMDHHPRAENQCARIYDVSVVKDAEKKTGYGDDYVRLVACCYMPRCAENSATIGMIEAGILKEVSVGCRMKKETCSICGNPYWSRECEHRIGMVYEDGKKCFVKLEEPQDAYELSFVAVPAQPAAGVVKGFEKAEDGKTFRAELYAMSGMMKELAAAVGQIEKNTRPDKDEPTSVVMDAEADALMSGAKALIKSIEGEM